MKKSPRILWLVLAVPIALAGCASKVTLNEPRNSSEESEPTAEVGGTEHAPQRAEAGGVN